MKKEILILLILVLWNSTTYGNDYIDESKQLGVVSYLTAVKSLSEYKMISLAADEKYSMRSEEAAEFRYHYNIIRLSVDRLINQLSVDMIDKNNVKKYRILNKYLRGETNELPKGLFPYKKLLEEIDVLSETFMLKTYSNMLAGPGLSDILGGIELVHTSITDARDSREKKVHSIVEILNKLKLESVKGLTEKRKSENSDNV